MRLMTIVVVDFCLSPPKETGKTSQIVHAVEPLAAHAPRVDEVRFKSAGVKAEPQGIR